MYSNSPSASWIENQLEVHSHRGPDHSNFKTVTPKLIMGANRLAMVDRHPRSNQPMTNQESLSTITFNGEIYNYRELRKELIAEGMSFATDSDTEVLLIGLENYGSDFLTRVNGMYAFVFFDKNENKLIFGRDHLGKKPLYLMFKKDSITWSSNIASFEISQANVNSDAIVSYLRFGYVLDPLTMANQVHSVSPGQTIEINLLSNEKIKRPIEQLRRKKQDSLRRTLTDAVESRIYSEDSIGISMSGGLDSTIVALICKNLGLKLKTYTAKWSDSDKARYNADADSARKISEVLDIEHCEVEMMESSQLPVKMREFVLAMEEPNNNPTGLSMMDLYSKINGDGVRLTLTGDGADELFSGYERYRKASHFPKLLTIDTNIWLNSGDNQFHKLINRFISAQFNDANFSFWASWHELFSHGEIKKLAGGKYNYASHNLFEEIGTIASESVFSKLQNQDLQVWIGMESNRRLDRISMFHSIEARSPFLDDNVVAFALNSRGFEFKTKSEVFKEEFPELKKMPVMAHKSGFVSPIGHWLRGNPEFVGESLSYLHENLGFSPAVMRRLELSPKLGDFEGMKKLWSLLILATWHDVYVTKSNQA